MLSDRKRVITALLAVLLAVAPAASARATGSTSPGERIANALRTSPVYVDDAYADAVSPTRRKQLVAQIEKTGLPIKVVLVPLTKGDGFDGDSDVLARVVHDRLPQHHLILITTDSDFADSLNGYEWPSDTHQTQDAVGAVGFLDEMNDAGLADRTAKAVQLVAEGDGKKVYKEATKGLRDSSSTPPTATSGSDGADWWLWPLVAVPALALITLVGRSLVHSRRSRSRTDNAAFPQVVFATARAADEAELRRRAEDEVLALGEETQAADADGTPGLHHALDAYAAAGTVLDAARGIPDLAGVLALVAEGRDALIGTPSPLPLCFFNPLHGRAAQRTTWRPLGRRERLKVATCQPCTDALRTRRAPEVLTDTTEDGREVPYFEIPGERSVWAATGYGALVRDREDGLAGRVTRGDFTRSLKSP
ncbi:hypothetical protein [Streptomyces sp. NPDC050564]|uniref:hypothetical protein n=1 Tax=Streptomyces sp. NPDC050564 TaxID=3365631 RepID=UPI0037A2647F